MTDESQEELILRHLDGETSGHEVDQVTRLLAEDAGFRSRFFAFASLLTEIQELVSISVGSGPTGSSTMPAVMTPRPPAAERSSASESAGSAIELRPLYLNAVVSGLGGLVGWLLVSLLDAALPLDKLNVYLRNALVVGPVLGVCIGWAVGSTEGLFASRSLRRMLRGGTVGACLGAVGGVIGLVLGELIFNLASPSVWSRSFGWGLFGMFVGVSEGVARKMPVKIRYGILGGLLGGLIGGSSYEGLLAVMRGMGFRAGALAWGSAIGLIILGACIGFLVSLVESLLRKAWLFFVTGRLEGQSRTLDSSRPHTIGSDPGCTIVIPNDPGVADVHAEIVSTPEGFQVRPVNGPVIIRRDGIDQEITAHVLSAGERVLIGGSRMIFRNVEGKQS